MNEIPSFFSANSTVMHISNYCFDLQINHSRRNWKETKRGVIRPSSPYVWGPVIIIVENFSPSYVFNTWNWSKVGWWFYRAPEGWEFKPRSGLIIMITVLNHWGKCATSLRHLEMVRNFCLLGWGRKNRRLLLLHLICTRLRWTLNNSYIYRRK